jgi:hypothetical protein
MGELPGRFVESFRKRDADPHEPLGDAQRFELLIEQNTAVAAESKASPDHIVALRQLLGEHGIGGQRLRGRRGGLLSNVFHGGSPVIQTAIMRPDSPSRISLARWRVDE